MFCNYLLLFWWLRSPNATNTNNFWYVNNNGNTNNNNANNSYGVCFDLLNMARQSNVRTIWLYGKEIYVLTIYAAE